MKKRVTEKPPACETVESLLSDDVMLQSLRRRLWGALQNEDIDTAIEVYTASRLEYLEWLAKEEEQSEAERRENEERKAKRKKEKRDSKTGLKKFGSMVQSSRQSLKTIECYSKQDDVDSGRRGSWKRMNEPAPLSTGNGIMLLSEQLEAARIQQVSPTSESRVGILQEKLGPSEPFTEDDKKHFADAYTKNEESGSEKPPVPRNVRVRRRKSVQPKLAGFFGRFGGSGKEETNSSEEDEDSDDDRVDMTMTTPLHEAARIGSGSLVRLMLTHGADPNLKNGQMRTALHMAAGGLTKEEEALLRGKYYHEKQRVERHGKDLSRSAEKKEPLGSEVGIQKSDPQSDESDVSRSDEDPSGTKGAKKAVRVVGRFFQRMGKSQDTGELTVENEVKQTPPPVPDLDRLNQLSSDRVDAVMALLLWSHPDDGGERACEGPSVNSVDVSGRTALHYAAELGRNEICMAVLNSFDAILTLIDDSGQTPCELAAERTHSELASQLEARALLCTDPYGMEDVMMDTIIKDSKIEAMNIDVGVHEDDPKTQTNTYKRSIVLHYVLKNHVGHPFDLFETWSMEEVRVERRFRVNAVFAVMKRIMDDRHLDRQMNDLMFSHANLDDGEAHNMEKAFSEVGGGSNTSLTEDNNEMKLIAATANTEVSKELHNDKTSILVMNLNEDDSGDACSVNASEERESSSIEKPDSSMNFAESNAMEEIRPTTNDGKEAETIEPEIWAALLPDGIETDERFTIGLNGRDIHVRCPPNVKPGETIRFVIESEPSDSAGDTKIRLVDSFPRQEKTDQESHGDKASPKTYPIHEAHVERFLAFHGWQSQEAVDIFKENPQTALIEAGITADLDSNGRARNPEIDHRYRMCLICFSEIAADSPEWMNLRDCEHGFCTGCMASYIANAAQSKTCGVCVACPHHECSSFLQESELEALAPDPAKYEALVQAADENFVMATRDFRFCPHPGCDCVVRCTVGRSMSIAPDSVGHAMTFAGAVCRKESYTATATEDTPYTYEGVRDPRYLSMDLCQPARAHRFCFHCGEEAHFPARCDTVLSWKARIEKEIGEVDDGEADTEGNIDEVAQRLWMKANTRPCPRCKVPIEKNDGCNHMTCSNRHCRHEFCWICRKDWKLHNTETGGFFRCNRWKTEEHEFYDDETEPEASQNGTANRTSADEDDDADSTNNQGYGTANHASKAAWKKSKIMARFLHHYRRWTAHCESAALEQAMADTVSSRLAPVVKAAIDISGSKDFDFGGKGLSFIHAAFIELLECRNNLQYSYAFAFFRFPAFYYSHQVDEMRLLEGQKLKFEYAQSRLEMITEQLSDLVARSHVRATQTQIMCLTKEAAERRRDFFALMLAFLSSFDEMRFNAESRHAHVPAIAPVQPPPQPSENETFAQDDYDDYDRFEEDALQRALRISMQTFTDQSEPTHDLIEATADEDEWTNWPCSMCTYMNAGGSFCAMCGTMRE